MDLTVAVAQTAPRLGELSNNLAALREAAGDARQAGAGLVLFPELALTGYALQDAVSDAAISARDGRLDEVAAASSGLALVTGFVEEGANGAFYNAALVAVDGRVRAVHRKRHLPTYGLFDEARFFRAGAGVTLFEHAGWRLGVLICEEAWYPQTVHEVVAAGAEALLVLANGPGRGLRGGARWQSQDVWIDLARHYAATYAVPVLLANRTGVEEGVFFGGSSVIVEPSGRVACEAPVFEPALLTAELTRAALRRARLRHPGRPTPPPALDPALFPAPLHGFA